VNAVNDAPVADAGGPYITDEGAEITFDASGSTDIDEDPLEFHWDFGDDSTGTGMTPTHIYADDGIYTVTLTVTDDDGGINSDTLTVTVNNVAPTVDAGPDQTVNEGGMVKFSGIFTDLGASDTHSIEWHFSDNPLIVKGILTHFRLYADNGVYTVTLIVTDDDGGVGSDTLTVTVNNVAPTADAGADQTVNEGETVSFSGSFTDPGLLDTYTFEWDFGDGNIASGTLIPTHTYDDNEVYTVTSVSYTHLTLPTSDLV